MGMFDVSCVFSPVGYLCLAFSVLWIVNFGYLFLLDRQLKDIGKRLDARAQH